MSYDDFDRDREIDATAEKVIPEALQCDHDSVFLGDHLRCLVAQYLGSGTTPMRMRTGRQKAQEERYFRAFRDGAQELS